MTTTLFIGIACFFDLTDSSGFLDYLLVQEHVESVNFVGGIQGRPVVFIFLIIIFNSILNYINVQTLLMMLLH